MKIADSWFTVEYEKYPTSLDRRDKVAENFLLIKLTQMMKGSIVYVGK